MIVPCIDLQGGRAVQLVRGRKCVLAVEDVFALLEKFRRHCYLHIIDLDAAIGTGNNDALVRQLCQRAAQEFGMRVRVGGGIRSVGRAVRVIGWGAEKVILGSAVFRNGKVNLQLLRRLRDGIGRRRVMLALDTERGCIVVRGWRRRLRLRPEEVVAQLEPFCSEFLCTYVDREGTLRGTNLSWFRSLRGLTRLPITAAGGICSRREVRALSRLGMKAAVGMALYTGKLR